MTTSRNSERALPALHWTVDDHQHRLANFSKVPHPVFTTTTTNNNNKNDDVNKEAKDNYNDDTAHATSNYLS